MTLDKMNKEIENALREKARSMNRPNTFVLAREYERLTGVTVGALFEKEVLRPMVIAELERRDPDGTDTMGARGWGVLDNSQPTERLSLAETARHHEEVLNRVGLLIDGLHIDQSDEFPLDSLEVKQKILKEIFEDLQETATHCLDAGPLRSADPYEAFGIYIAEIDAGIEALTLARTAILGEMPRHKLAVIALNRERHSE